MHVIWINWAQYFAYVYEKEAYLYNINEITAFFKQNPEIEVGIENLKVPYFAYVYEKGAYFDNLAWQWTGRSGDLISNADTVY